MVRCADEHSSLLRHRIDLRQQDRATKEAGGSSCTAEGTPYEPELTKAEACAEQAA